MCSAKGGHSSTHRRAASTQSATAATRGCTPGPSRAPHRPAAEAAACAATKSVRGARGRGGGCQAAAWAAIRPAKQQKVKEKEAAAPLQSAWQANCEPAESNSQAWKGRRKGGGGGAWRAGRAGAGLSVEDAAGGRTAGTAHGKKPCARDREEGRGAPPLGTSGASPGPYASGRRQPAQERPPLLHSRVVHFALFAAGRRGWGPSRCHIILVRKRVFAIFAHAALGLHPERGL